MLISSNGPLSLLVIVCNALLLPLETQCTAAVYVHRYARWIKIESDQKDSIDDQKKDSEGSTEFDTNLLQLAAISLAAKATENLRRLSEIIAPAYEIVSLTEKPLEIPSDLYDDIRQSVSYSTF